MLRREENILLRAVYILLARRVASHCHPGEHFEFHSTPEQPEPPPCEACELDRKAGEVAEELRKLIGA